MTTMSSLPEGLEKKLADVPDAPGCYLYKDADARVIYVGKAKSLRKRVATYFQKSADHPAKTLRLVQEVVDAEFIVLGSEVEALVVENRLIKELQPRFNMRLKDGKEFPFLAISREEFPRVFITRNPDEPQADLIGPFTSANDLHRAYHFLQRTFRFRTCDLDLHESDPGRRHFRACLNWHIKRCSAPCTTRIDAAGYGADIRALRAFVGGRGAAPVVAELGERMKACSAEQRYEDAARLRDQIQAIGRLKERGDLRHYADDGAAPVIDLHAGLAALHQALGLARPPQIIEGFDIAHLQGQHVVASLVRFVQGVPDKDGYRRFKVKVQTNDDFAAMEEVVGRRYRRLVEEGQVMPDLVMIDGGHGQVGRAMAAITAAGATPGAVIGLAKKVETIIRSDGSELRLSKRDPGLKLLMYVRDEAHRFCRRYFHLLQRQVLVED
jgi:excinuclease ABC subunit C